MKISRQTLEKLKTFDSPTVCNVIELFGVRPRSQGYMDARIQACFPKMPPVVGFAATATFRSAAPPRGGDVYAGLTSQLERFEELSGPPLVVFQDLDDPPASATFGEVMCSAYNAFGAVGLVTSGAGRDLEQVEALDFPVFTNGTICSHGYAHTLHIHGPVHVGGITVYPDDLLHADLNGVTTIPKDLADEVADACAEWMAAEKITLELLRRKDVSVADFKKALAETDARVEELRQQVASNRLP